jgi:outer membrane protein assembly factor BamB
MKHLVHSLFKLIIIIHLGFILSCSESPNEPDGKDIKSPQKNILWPSLADSPWPMNHHDPQSTGRSKYLGPRNGSIETKLPLYGIEGSIALDEENSIYLGTQYQPYKLFKYSIAGELIWESIFNTNTPTTPIIGSNHNVYASSGTYGSIYCLKYDGTVKWKNETSGSYNIGMNIGLDSNLYYISTTSELNCINQYGEVLWNLNDDRFRSDADGAPTFSPDGEYLYIQGSSVSVIAVNIINKKVEWEFGTIELRSSPVVDNSGNLYFVPENYKEDNKRTLHSLNSHGNLNWCFSYGRENEYQFDNTEPTIDYDGNIYFGNDTLYSLNFEGELRWKRSLEGRKVVSPLVSDIECNIYIGVTQSEPHRDFVLAYDRDGKIIWELEIENERLLGASPAITDDGRLVFPTFRAWNILVIN